jgi:hypothetical protein
MKGTGQTQRVGVRRQREYRISERGITQKSSFRQNWNHFERNHSERNHSERNHSERNHSEKNHSERNHSERNHSERNHSERNHSEKKNSEILLVLTGISRISGIHKHHPSYKEKQFYLDVCKVAGAHLSLVLLLQSLSKNLQTNSLESRPRNKRDTLFPEKRKNR